MKITRNQLKRIIEQAMVTGDDLIDSRVEAALVLRFVGTYLFVMRGVLRKADRAKYRDGFYPGSQYMYITNFWKNKNGPVNKIRRLGDELTADRLGTGGQLVSAEDAKSIDKEALSARDDHSSSVTEKIDDLMAYLYDQTPMGMSAIDAAKVYGKNIKPQADAIAKMFDDRTDYFNTLEDSTEFDG